MENGSYGRANTDFAKLVLDKFTATMYDAQSYAAVGCGASALGLLTGVNPVDIVKRNGYRSDYTDGFMLRFLRKHGFQTYKVTKCNLTSRNNTSQLVYQLNDNHLILYSCLLKRNEASWFVTWNGIQYHNFELCKSSFLGLLNFPLCSAYVLFKKSWAARDLSAQYQAIRQMRQIQRRVDAATES